MYVQIRTRIGQKKLYELMSASKSSKFRDHISLVPRTWIVAFVFLSLTSCQYFPKAEDLVDGEDSKTYQGRIAFKSPEQSFVTIFRWLESDSTFQLTLRDRLALGGVRLHGNENDATIEYSNGKIEEGVDLDEWIDDNLGISVPFKELWKCLSLNCKLIDEADQQEYDQYGRIESFAGNQWTFTFSYRDADSDSSILKKLEMRKEDTKIRIFFTKFEN